VSEQFEISTTGFVSEDDWKLIEAWNQYRQETYAPPTRGLVHLAVRWLAEHARAEIEGALARERQHLADVAAVQKMVVAAGPAAKIPPADIKADWLREEYETQDCFEVTAATVAEDAKYVRDELAAAEAALAILDGPGIVEVDVLLTERLTLSPDGWARVNKATRLVGISAAAVGKAAGIRKGWDALYRGERQFEPTQVQKLRAWLAEAEAMELTPAA
jgi:hypothetical protein